jgi:hypothetical protein
MDKPGEAVFENVDEVLSGKIIDHTQKIAEPQVTQEPKPEIRDNKKIHTKKTHSGKRHTLPAPVLLILSALFFTACLIASAIYGKRKSWK